MHHKAFAWFVAAQLLIVLSAAEAQQPKPYHVGVVFHGGEWNAVLVGLRDGLRELGMEDGKQYALEVRNTRGDLKAVNEIAKDLEKSKVDLIYAVATSVTLRVRDATSETPIVFCAGTDPVSMGLVKSFAKPGGRLSGVHFLATDLTPKRLEILKQIQPKLQRAVTFYDPGNPVARQSVKLGREEAHRLKVDLVERQVASVEEFQAAMQALRVSEFDAFLLVADAMVLSQSELIIDVAKNNKMSAMFWEEGSVSAGGLVSYGVSYQEAGRLSAKYVQRILTGTRPQDLPIETVRKLDFVINLKTAKQIGLTIPPNVLARADRVIR